eukprot:6711543-Prymnesium_polylepis.1
MCSVAFATSRDQNSPPRWHLSVSVEKIASSWRVWLDVSCVRCMCSAPRLRAACTRSYKLQSHQLSGLRPHH